MPYLLLGALILLIAVAALRWASRTSPVKIGRMLTIVGGVVLSLIALRFALAGKLLALLPFIAGLFSVFGPRLWRRSQPSAGATSEVETDTVRMTLDHDTGEIGGEVIRGAFAGRNLNTMMLDDLIDLLNDCRGNDPEAARLIETYIDRVHGTAWRRRDDRATGAGPQRDEAGAMSLEQAYKVLGLEPGASRDDIKRAHRNLMKKIHPDQGGTDWLAARINQAKEVLLDE